MDLGEAIEILKIEKGCAELAVSNNQGNKNTENFIEATNIVLNFIYEILRISKIK